MSPFGEAQPELGCDPRDAAMILQGSFLGCGRDMAVIAAIRSANRKLLPTPAGERDAAERQHRKFFVSDTSDLINHLNVYRQAEINGFDSNWCRENFVSFPALREIRQAAGDLMRNAGDLGYDMESRDAGEQTLRQAIATGFPDRVFHYMVGGWYQNLETGQRAKLGRDSVISRAQRIIANDFIRITTKEGEELPLISAATVIT